MINRSILKIICFQVAVTLVIAGVYGVFSDETAAVSSALGGGVGFLTSLSYAWRSSSHCSEEPKKLLQAQYAGERLKFLIAVILFGATFKFYHSLQVPQFFLAYIATLLVYFGAFLLN